MNESHDRFEKVSAGYPGISGNRAAGSPDCAAASFDQNNKKLVYTKYLFYVILKILLLNRRGIYTIKYRS